MVQPIFAKMLLPLLGGSPSVWNTALVFYQAVLLLGYGYAHILTNRVRPKVQAWIHAAVLVVPLALLPIRIFGSGIPPNVQAPIAWLLVIMVVSIGLPFFAVSTSGPLLQRWFSKTGHRAAADPYFLYAASNFGSMLALLGYPLLLEPYLPLKAQSAIWSFGYGLLIACVVGCLVVFLMAPGEARMEIEAEEVGRLEAPNRGRKLRWVFLAFLPSSLMMGATTYISTDIAAVPLLWVLPLAIYLLSFIVVFARRPWVPLKITLWLMPASLLALAVIMSVPITKPLYWILGLHLFTLFMASLACHGQIAEDRPPAKHLTEFYFLLSVGGVLGGIFNAIVAPLLFSSVLEYHLALVLLGLSLPWKGMNRSTKSWAADLILPFVLLIVTFILIWAQRRFGLTSEVSAKRSIFIAAALCALLFVKRPLRFGLSVGSLMLLGAWLNINPGRNLYRARSFFGVYRVEVTPGGEKHRLFHGTTLHGVESTKPAEYAIPLSYYFSTGPIGQVFAARKDFPGGAVGAVGLGVGSLAAYSRPGQHWTFYEIDPVVLDISRNPRFFHFLEVAKGPYEVVLGDARLSLQASSRRFDLLVLDAYSSDAVPLHLITTQAMKLYLARLASHGIIAFHISNRHLDLEPVLANFADEFHLQGLIQRDNQATSEERALGKARADWVIFARAPSDFGTIAADQRWVPLQKKKGVALWTDDYSSILTVLTGL